MNLKELENSLFEKDVSKASEILTKIYANWDEMDEQDQKRVNELESVYLTMVSAQGISESQITGKG